MNSTERLQYLINFLDLKAKDLESRTGIDRDRWNNLRRPKPVAKIRLEEAEAISSLYPEYSLWLISGITAPEAGQISPDMEEIREKLGKA